METALPVAFHVRLFASAFSGKNTGFSWSLPLTEISVDSGSSIRSIGTSTFTVQEAFLPPVVTAVIMVVPFFRPVTLPFWSTRAISSSALLHLSPSSEAFAGCTLKASVCVSPSYSEYFFALKAIDFTSSVTQIRHCAASPL